MKKLLLCACAALLTLSAAAALPVTNRVAFKGQPTGMFAMNQQLAGKIKGQKAITRGTAKATDADLVTVPDGVTIETDWTINGSFTTSQGATSIEEATSVAINGTDVYIKGLAYYFPDAWVKGTLSGTTVTFPVQYVGSDDYGEEYLGGYSSSGPTSFTFTYDATANSFTLSGYLVEYDGNTSEAQMWGYYTALEVVKGEIVKPDVVTPPDGLTTEDFVFIAYACDSIDSEGNIVWQTETTQLDLKIGIDGDVVYIQGLCTYLPEAWVTGSFNENNELVIPTGQYFGAVNNVYDIYLLGYDSNGLGNIVFAINEEYGVYTTEQLVILSSKANAISWYEIYGGGAIGQLVDEAMYLIGSFNDWNEENMVALTKGEDGKWTATQEMAAGAEFKFKNEAGEWLGGHTDDGGTTFLVTEEQVTGGTELTLDIPGVNFVIPVAGTWTFTVDKENNKVVISGEWVNPQPEKDHVYILGEVNGNSWAPNVGPEMTSEDGVNFTADVTCSANNSGYSYFSFTTKLADNANDWAGILAYRMGATANDFEVTDALMGTELTVQAGTNAFKIADGEYTLALNLETMKLVVTKKAAAKVGDVNLDGKVDVEDMNIIINIMLETDSADNYDGRANLNGDEKVDVEDMNEVINIMLTQE